MGWLSWFRPAPKHWYYLSVVHPVHGGANYGPRYLTDSAAQSWQIDHMEAYWDSEVRRYRWTGVYWAAA